MNKQISFLATQVKNEVMIFITLQHPENRLPLLNTETLKIHKQTEERKQNNILMLEPIGIVYCS